MSEKDFVDSFLKKHEITFGKLSMQKNTIMNLVKVLNEARKKGYAIYTMGNGGSGSTASHFVSDLLKTAITKGDKRFTAISLTDNMPVLLAWANDVSYDDIFVEQLKNFLAKNDIIIGFSGSGNSKNIVKAMTYGKKNGALCIGITGMSGGKLSKICDISLVVPSQDMLVIESIHVTLCHCIVSTIRNMGKPLFRYD